MVFAAPSPVMIKSPSITSAVTLPAMTRRGSSDSKGVRRKTSRWRSLELYSRPIDSIPPGLVEEQKGGSAATPWKCLLGKRLRFMVVGADGLATPDRGSRRLLLLFWADRRRICHAEQPRRPWKAVLPTRRAA